MNKHVFDFQIQYLKKLGEIQKIAADQKGKAPFPAFQAWQDSMMQAGTKFWQSLLDKPETLLEMQADFFKSLNDNQPPANYQSYNKYFKSDLWGSSPYFQWLKTFYIQAAEWLIDTIEEETEGFSAEDKTKIRFLTKQWIDGMNPRNFPLTNPEIIAETLKTGGQNILKGMDNLAKDMQQGMLSMTAREDFVMGENIAATPGEVIYRNEMMELIAYHPREGGAVYKEPLVIVPPWINKYYILDLTPEKSMIKWMVDQGHRVFCISWTNPDETMRDKGFADYMHDGALAAIAKAMEVTGASKVNTIGYCIGGTLLAMTLAWLEGQSQTPSSRKRIASKASRMSGIRKASAEGTDTTGSPQCEALAGCRGDDTNIEPASINSATFMTTLLDFENAGDLKIFMDEGQIESLKTSMEATGIMDGKAMAMSFSMLRAAELIWSFVVNNYWMGRDPVPFDILYWNSDSTNLPAAMHYDYLKSFYLENKLIKGTYTLDGVRLDLTKITTPAYFLSTREDHIAPWQATQAGMVKLGSADKSFVLGGSGHVAGVINPPHKNKYGYQADGEDHEGSWWTHWQDWVSQRSKAVKA